MLVMSVFNKITGLVDAMPSGSMPLYGVTVDVAGSVFAMVGILSHLSRTPIVRVVSDEGTDAPHYAGRVAAIRNMTYVTGELADSSMLKQYTTPQLRQRVAAYLHILAGNVDVWGIGNEIDSEWTGPIREVIDKIVAAYEVTKTGGGRTALTPYCNEGCTEQPSRAMFDRTQRNVPLCLRDGPDYVFISLHEDDCKIVPPDWDAVFTHLRGLLPHAVLSLGEVGARHTMRKAALVAYYYGLTIAYLWPVGRYSWWCFRQDMVLRSRPL